MDHMQALEQIRQILAAISQDPSVSPQETAILEKITTLIQSIPASRDKERQAALGSSPAMNHVARVVGGTA